MAANIQGLPLFPAQQSFVLHPFPIAKQNFIWQSPRLPENMGKPFHSNELLLTLPRFFTENSI
jgi:hypothetical protein